MDLLALILAGAAVYLLTKKNYEEKISDLEKDNDKIIVENQQKEDEIEKLQNQIKGELNGRIECFMEVYASCVTTGLGDNWNTGYDLIVKNISSNNISIGGVRVFWSAAGHRSIWSPWSVEPITLKPGVETTIRLFGTKDAWHFNGEAAIKAVESEIYKKGKYYDSELKTNVFNPLPIDCDAEFILTAQGTNYLRTVKDFPGELIGLDNIWIHRPNKVASASGENQTVFDDARKNG